MMLLRIKKEERRYICPAITIAFLKKSYCNLKRIKVYVLLVMAGIYYRIENTSAAALFFKNINKGLFFSFR